jgi:tetratricopeptide (TPR) repeat protein
MELYPNRPWLIEKRARVYVKAGKYNLALRDANQLVSQFPQSDGQELRAEIWQSMKQYDKALLDYNNSIAKMPNASPDRYSNRARIYERLGMYQEAICDLETVLQIDPNESEAADAIARLKVLNRS